MRIIPLIIALGLIVSCQSKKSNAAQEAPTAMTSTISEAKEAKVPEGNLFTNSIEAAHKKQAYLEKDMLQFDIQVSFGGNIILDATLTQYTDGSKIRIDNRDQSYIVFDGDQVLMSPANANAGMARFHIFTWSYFLNLPYKLNDKGTIWSEVTNRVWGEAQTFTSSKLTFNNGVGDAPDDWYIVYKHPNTDILEGAAYIVTFGKVVAEAEKEPHAIKYDNFQYVADIPIATNWTFHMWEEAKGYGDKIGEATISNISFLDKNASLFQQPDSFQVVKAPK